MTEKTKSVSGRDVPMSKFAYVRDPEDLETWKLPIHDASHVRNALARYNQTDLPAEAKEGVWRKIVAAAKKFGIEVSASDVFPDVGDVGARHGSTSLTALSLSKGGVPLLTNVYSAALRLVLAEPVLMDVGARHGVPLREHIIAITGTWIKNDRKFSITADDLADLVRNFQKRKTGMVEVDYEHASEMPEVARGGPVPAAGWIHELKIGSLSHLAIEPSGNLQLPIVNLQLKIPTPQSPNGPRLGETQSPNGSILTAFIEWTPEAEGMIREGQYRFFSPAIDWGAKDKETGDPQGATLTSGALTNHPFLEELPAIILSDNDSVFSSQSSVVSSQSLKTENCELRTDNFSSGGKMKIKFMKGAGKGKLRVKADDESLSFDDVDFEDIAEAMDDEAFEQIAGKRGYKKMQDEEVAASALLREAGIADSGLKIEDLKSAIINRQSEIRKALLAETVKDGKIDLDRAAGLADAQKIGFADYRAAQRASEGLEEAVKAGKILPRDREFFARVALSDPEKFAAWSKQAPAVINLATVGIGGGHEAQSENPAEEMHARVKQVMSDKNLSYLDATRLLASTEPELVRRYRSAIGKE